MKNSNSEYSFITVSVSFAIVTYLLFTFVIGFISISVGWLLNSVSETAVVVLAISPVFLFFLLHKLIEKFSFQIIITVLLWTISAFMPIVEIKYILIILGIYFSLVSFKFFLMLYIHSSKQISSKIFVIALFSMDQLLKLFNQGQIPLINTSFIGIAPVIIFTLFSIVYLLESTKFVKTSVQQINAFDSPLEDDFNPRPYGIFAVYFLFFLYFFVFGNMGPISYNLSLFLDSTFNYGPLIIIGLMLIYYFFKKENYFEERESINTVKIIAIALLISLIFYPWFSIQLIFWVVGIVALIILLDFSIGVIRYKDENQITNFISISYLLMIVFIFVMLLTELNMIFGIIAGIIGISVITIYPFRNIRLKSISFSFSSTFFISKQQDGFFNWRLRYQSLFLILLIVFNLFVGVVPSLFQAEPISSTKTSGMTYNLHFGLDSYGFDNIDRVSALVLSEAPSFVGFQEVTFSSPLNGYKNMFDALKRNLSPNYPYYYYSEQQTGVLSNAFFSMYPIINASTITLEPTVRYQRNMLNLVLDIEGNFLRVIVLHLTHVIEKESNPNRVKQAQFVIDQIDLSSNLPTIILGDFNAWPEFTEAKVFSDRYQDAWNTTNPDLSGFTWPTLDPSQRIDYIFLDNSLNVTNCETIQDFSSDHFPLSCEFEF